VLCHSNFVILVNTASAGVINGGGIRNKRNIQVSFLHIVYLMWSQWYHYASLIIWSAISSIFLRFVLTLKNYGTSYRILESLFLRNVLDYDLHPYFCSVTILVICDRHTDFFHLIVNIVINVLWRRICRVILQHKDVTHYYQAMLVQYAV